MNSSTDPIRAVIVDDEAHGRAAVRRLLRKRSEFEIVAECSGGGEAVDVIRALNPDVAFLDIQMPKKDGFDVLLELGAEAPVPVMVTAHDSHALRAFEHHALDYLLKPVDPERFEVALQRVVDRVRERRGGQESETLHSLLDDLSGKGRGADRIVIKSAGSLVFIHTHEFRWAEAAGNYIKVHADAQEYLVRLTMEAMLEHLDPRQFVRIHRSFLVNVSFVRELRAAKSGGSAKLLLNDGTELTIGRSYRAELERRLVS